MHYRLNKWVEMLIEESVAGGEFASTNEAIEFAVFSQQPAFTPLFRNSRAIDHELERGRASGTPTPFEQPDRLSEPLPTRILARPAARADLAHVWNQLGRAVTPVAARQYALILSSQLVVLASFPSLGTQWRGNTPSVRLLLLGNFAIFYHPLPDGVELLRILPVNCASVTIQ